MKGIEKIPQEKQTSPDEFYEKIDTSFQAQQDFKPERLSRTSDQLDNLIESTKLRREASGLSHKEAYAQKSEFYQVRSSIRTLRARLRAIEDSPSIENQNEVQELRDALAVELNAFRKVMKAPEKADQESSTDQKVSSDVLDTPEMSIVNEADVKVGNKYRAMIDGLLTIVTIKVLTDKNLYAVTYEKNGKELTYTVSKDELQPLTNQDSEVSDKKNFKTSKNLVTEDALNQSSVSAVPTLIDSEPEITYFQNDEFLKTIPDRSKAFSSAIRELDARVKEEQKNFGSTKRATLYERFKTRLVQQVKRKYKLALVLPLLLTLGSDSPQEKSKDSFNYKGFVSETNDQKKSQYDGVGSLNEYFAKKDFQDFKTIKPVVKTGSAYNTSGALNEYLSPTDPHEFSVSKKSVIEGKILDKMVETEKTDLQQEEIDDVAQTYDLQYTFIPGDKINTVSEALCSLVEKNPSLIEGDMTPGEAVREFNHEIEHLKQDNPDAYEDLLDQMGVTSGDIDEVGAGKTYNFAPLFEYLNSLPQ